MAINIARRKFVATLSGAVAWPLTARAQQADRMQRVGVLNGSSVDDTQGQADVAAFLQGLQQLAGQRAATCSSRPAGARAIPPTCANTRRNWSHLRLTSFWLVAPRVWGR